MKVIVRSVRMMLATLLAGAIFGVGSAAADDAEIIAVCGSPYGFAGLISSSAPGAMPGAGALDHPTADAMLYLSIRDGKYDLLVTDANGQPHSLAQDGATVMGMSPGKGIYHLMVFRSAVPEQYLFAMSPEGTGEMLWGSDSELASDDSMDYRAECRSPRLSDLAWLDIK